MGSDKVTRENNYTKLSDFVGLIREKTGFNDLILLCKINANATDEWNRSIDNVYRAVESKYGMHLMPVSENRTPRHIFSESSEETVSYNFFIISEKKLYRSIDEYGYKCMNKLYPMLCSFKMKGLPGCCGIIVSYSSHVASEFQKMGIGSILNDLRIFMAKRMGYSVMISTNVVGNKAQERILEKNGWSSLFSFKNKSTGNNVNFSLIDL